MNAFLTRLRSLLQATTPAVWVLLLLAAVSAAHVVTRENRRLEGGVMWTFSRPHSPGYYPVIENWNREYPDNKYNLLLLDYGALESRMLSGFLSGTPVADLMEVERNIAARAFTGPLDDVGFVDLTDRLRAEGLIDTINPPSFSPWTSRGRIFGLPHDVHPVLLAYRADLVEEAGVDLSGVETWDQFFDALRPMMKDTDGDNRPDRYILNYWPTNSISTEMLLLQAGGAMFDVDERPVLDSEINARVVATLATWCSGPSRIAVDAPEFSAAGNALKLQGVVVASLVPDWLAGVWKTDLPTLSGKWRLMPLPAWTPGGLRTSVQGGSMLGIPKNTPDFESAWQLAKRLYLDPERNAEFFRRTNIIPPSRASWSQPVFDEPDAYFGGQPSGRLFINQAPSIPARSSSPFNTLALARVTDVIIALSDQARAQNIADPEALLPEARRLLADAQAQVTRQISRNVFLAKQ
ncbi:MAG: extracellular solute-binding protein [Verrucomicrobiota bacterium]